MGGLNTKHFKDLLEEDVPPTPPIGKRPLEAAFDPRSPSSAIPRTPIHVDKTPDVLNDPRSPSTGINRTPIYTSHSANNAEKLLIDPSMTIDPMYIVAFTPHITTNDYTDTPVRGLGPDYDRENESDDLDLPPSPELSPTSGSPGISNDSGIQNDSESSVELMSRSCSEPDLLRDDKVLIKRPTSAKKFSLSSSSGSKKVKPKTLFQGNSNSSPSTDGPNSKPSKNDRSSPRSPLSVLSEFPSRRLSLGRSRKEVDSPRAIVQRKQVSKLVVAKSQGSSGPDFKVYYDDKENVSVKEVK